MEATATPQPDAKVVSKKNGRCDGLLTVKIFTSRLLVSFLQLVARNASFQWSLLLLAFSAAPVASFSIDAAPECRQQKLLQFQRPNHNRDLVSLKAAQRQRQRHRNHCNYPPLPRRRNVLDIEQDLLLLLLSKSDAPVPDRNSKHSTYTYTHILGSDESGTGAIAGPVVTVSCSVLNMDLSASQSGYGYAPLGSVRDSKQLSLDECQTIFKHVQQHTPTTYQWAYSVKTATEIDDGGLIPTTQLAFGESIQQLMHQIIATTSNTTTSTATIANPNANAPTTAKHRFYSIVDGSKSPSSQSLLLLPSHRDLHNQTFTINSRPWPRADATVYTVALASCLARAVHQQIVQRQLESRHPQFEFDTHGGYPSRRHLELLHRYGPIEGVHRRSCQPVRDRLGGASCSDHDPNRNNAGNWERQSFLRVVAASLLTHAVGPWATATTADAATTSAGLPDRGEIESAVPMNDQDWIDVENPITEDVPLSRLDSTSDTLFYQEPRFVEHVDEQAVRLMTDYISSLVQTTYVTSVLDVCASWTSHMAPHTVDSNLKRVAGLGMNTAELQANPSLTEWAVQDLNVRPTLPYENDSFDVILCQLSMDYLTQPLRVCRELLRVARPTGTIHILYSNRLFLTKAVAVWTGKDDVDRTFLLASYLRFCSADNSSNNNDYFWDHIAAQDLSVRDRRGRIIGDPVYVVTATKRRY